MRLYSSYARSGIVLLLLLLSVGITLAASNITNDGGDDDEGDESTRPLTSIDSVDIVAIVLMSLGLALASAGGVGGGPIIVPLLVLAMGFDIKQATPVSNVVIIGGAIANAIFNFQKSHPTVDRPLIDPDLALAMIPPMIGGAVIGAFLSKLLPGYIISLLFVCVLAVAGAKSMTKAIKLHKKELSKRKAAGTEDVPLTPLPYQEATSPSMIEKALPEQASLQVATTQEPCASVVELIPTDASTEDSIARLAQLLETERNFSWTKHGMILLCYLGIVAASIGGSKSHCGGVAYWLLLWGEIPWVLPSARSPLST